MSKKQLIGVLVIAVLSLGVVSAASAQEILVNTPNYGQVMAIADGRLNEFDVAAPVAVYYTYQGVTNTDGTVQQVPNGIELLAIDRTTNEGKLALNASLADLKKLTSGKVSSLSGQGFSLNYKAGWFWVTAPADSEGKVYSFSWQNETFAVG